MSTSTFALDPQRWAIDPGPLQPLLQSYICHLVGLGYRAASIDTLEKRARHFCYWLNQVGVSVTHADENIITRFARHSCHCPGNRGSETLSKAFIGMVRHFVRFLEESQVVPPSARLIDDDHFREYLNWLRQHRGLSETTIHQRRKLMRQIVPLLGPDPGKYDAAGIRNVIVSEAQRRSPVNMKSVVTGLRSYFRYLASQGLCSGLLCQAVPSVAHWKHSNLPKYLPADRVEALISSCDATTATGIRDRAILLLLARLGLRAADVMMLRFDDIGWQDGSLRVSGKARRQSKLPLPQDVGDALMKYLAEARPNVPLTQVFLRALAPYRPFSHSTAISLIVRRRLVGAGIIDAPSNGSHLLRHSAATSMLRAGTPLAAIGVILRHQSIDTTAQYAKVDVPSLKRIAQPWPGGASC